MSRGYLDYPLGVGTQGRIRTTDADDHVRDLIHQVLFTAPGERVGRPDFGCGLKGLLFMPAGDVVAMATQFTVQGALHQWLGDRIRIEGVQIITGESVVTVEVQYTRRDTGEQLRDRFAVTA